MSQDERSQRGAQRGMSQDDRMSRQGMSRRSVVRAAVWSVPVVAAAASVPLASASLSGAELALTAGCSSGGGLGAGFTVANVGTAPFSGHINMQEFLDIGAAVDVGNIPYAYSLRRHQFSFGGVSPLGWSFPGNRRRGNRTANFIGVLEPGQSFGLGQLLAWTDESEVSTQPDGWLAHLSSSAIIRSITPDDGTSVSGLEVGSMASFVWSDAIDACAL